MFDSLWKKGSYTRDEEEIYISKKVVKSEYNLIQKDSEIDKSIINKYSLEHKR